MKLKLFLLLVFISFYSWSQTTNTFTTSSGTLVLPAGVTSIFGQAWGGGGSGGGASGAGLLLGRGAAGGGGGAYASARLSVTSGATLNVVVAGQTTGTTGANGTTGGNSTIIGYESSFLAAGGSGGGANNAGGTPLGGVGGTVANSAGTVRFAGTNGGNGTTGALLINSGAGGGGANFGGAGGAAVMGALLGSNAPGNAGAVSGGGGSGAINSGLGAAQVGGSGAAGKVIVSYNCPTYNITGTTASNVCLGTTSTITVVSSAALLPTGSYVVTYNRSSPSATALTANMTVSTAGTGTFTVTGLTTVGTSTITITKLSSENCSSNITTNNTATITVFTNTVGGTVFVPNGEVDYGSTSGVLTLVGNVGSVIKWQYSINPFTTWIDVPNPSTSTDYTSVALTETTDFRAVVKNGVCGTENSFSNVVLVKPRPTIALASSAISVCESGIIENTILSYKTTTGDPTTYSIVWDSSPANSFVPVVDAALPTSPITIAVSGGTAAGTYTGTLTVKNANGVASINYPFDLVVHDTPTIVSYGTVKPIHASANLQNGELFYDRVYANPTAYRIDWNDNANNALLVDQPNTPFTFSPNGGVLNTIVIPANVPPGNYTGEIYIFNEYCSEHEVIFLEVTPGLPTIALASSAKDICFSDNATSTSLSYKTTTGDPTTYSIVWDSSPANSFVPVVDAELPTSPITIDVPGGTVAGFYTGTLTVKNANGDVSGGYAFELVVNASPTITTTGSVESVYTSVNSQNTTLAYDTTTGNPTSYLIDWNYDANQASLADQGATPFIFPSSGGAIDTIVIPANVPAGTYYGDLYVDNVTCFNMYPISITVTDILSIGLAESASNICTSKEGNAQNTTIDYSGTTGDPITYSIVWDSTPTNSFVSVVDAALPTSPITIDVPGGAVAGIYTGTLTVKNANGDVSGGYAFELVVNETPTITTTGSVDSVYTSVNSQNATLAYNTTTGNPTSYLIDWNYDANQASLADQGSTPFTFPSSGGAINTIVISADVPPGTYYGDLYIDNVNCYDVYPISITVISAEVPRIGLSTSENKILISALSKVITVETSDETIDKVYVFDVSGNLLYQKDAVGNPKLSINNLKSANQVLVVKVVLDNNKTQTTKVIY